MKDRHVEAVIEKMRIRSEVGHKKYGTNLERTDYDFLDWLREAQTEAMDFALYCEAAMSKIGHYQNICYDSESQFKTDLRNVQNMQD